VTGEDSSDKRAEPSSVSLMHGAPGILGDCI
jgi:hypothetical protein